MNCVICNGKANLNKVIQERQFRKEDFAIVEHFYKCENCGEEFTTTEIDELNLIQIHNQYRAKHHIPFPEEIIAIRDKYKLSAARMSEVLGFGTNSYRNYENGEIPSIANAKLISLAKDPNTFKAILESNSAILKVKEFEQLIKLIDSLNEKDNEFYFTELINFTNNIPNEFTGFKLPGLDKIKNLVLFFLEHTQKEFADKLKLNKLLFYSDFLHYKDNGYSISGIEYRAAPYGPVPSNYDMLYSILERDAIIERRFENVSNKKTYELFEANTSYNQATFNDREMKIILLIVDKFNEMSSWDLVNISHKEKAWIELKEERDIISYQKYGFDLVGI
jgi:putative zinc finger/helix-turn-helix YgiT family protein